MNALTKSNGNKNVIPSVKSFFDNFWNADPFFTEDFFNMRKQWLPAVNIKDQDGQFDIEVAAPGFDKKDFEVKIENGMLSISAEKKTDKEEKEDNYTRKEFSYNSFRRSFALPENADAKNIEAKYADGVLRLTLEKVEMEEPEVKKIEIK